MHKYEQDCKKLYNSIKSVWPKNSIWYNYTKAKIEDFIINKLKDKTDTSSKILNAGSGGTTYQVKGEYYHIDIAEKQIENLKNSYVASVEDLPFNSNLFDYVICVGSVINYCNAFSAISEISRVIKNGGFLILEYERSNTGELFLKKEYGKKSCVQIYKYNNQDNHRLWLYSDKYIHSILNEHGFIIDKESIEYFHCISALVNRFVCNEEVSGKYQLFDYKCPKIIKRKLAHNCILVCQKQSFS